ncbi:MAG: hypothetical protein ABH854_04195 [Candidatus Diapherotrites archaeon]
MAVDMKEYAREISTINARISRMQGEKGMLVKRLELKRKRKTLMGGEEREINSAILNKDGEIAGLRSKIRAMENEQERARNLRRE